MQQLRLSSPGIEHPPGRLPPWRERFLSDDEYREQARRCTATALEGLRHTPEFNARRVEMAKRESRLKVSRFFAFHGRALLCAAAGGLLTCAALSAAVMSSWHPSAAPAPRSDTLPCPAAAPFGPDSNTCEAAVLADEAASSASVQQTAPPRAPAVPEQVAAPDLPLQRSPHSAPAHRAEGVAPAAGGDRSGSAHEQVPPPLHSQRGVQSNHGEGTHDAGVLSGSGEPPAAAASERATDPPADASAWQVGGGDVDEEEFESLKGYWVDVPSLDEIAADSEPAEPVDAHAEVGYGPQWGDAAAGLDAQGAGYWVEVPLDASCASSDGADAAAVAVPHAASAQAAAGPSLVPVSVDLQHTDAPVEAQTAPQPEAASQSTSDAASRAAVHSSLGFGHQMKLQPDLESPETGPQGSSAAADVSDKQVGAPRADEPQGTGHREAGAVASDSSPLASSLSSDASSAGRTDHQRAHSQPAAATEATIGSPARATAVPAATRQPQASMDTEPSVARSAASLQGKPAAVPTATASWSEQGGAQVGSASNGRGKGTVAPWWTVCDHESPALCSGKTLGLSAILMPRRIPYVGPLVAEAAAFVVGLPRYQVVAIAAILFSLWWLMVANDEDGAVVAGADAAAGAEGEEVEGLREGPGVDASAVQAQTNEPPIVLQEHAPSPLDPSGPLATGLPTPVATAVQALVVECEATAATAPPADSGANGFASQHSSAPEAHAAPTAHMAKSLNGVARATSEHEAVVVAALDAERRAHRSTVQRLEQVEAVKDDLAAELKRTQTELAVVCRELREEIARHMEQQAGAAAAVAVSSRAIQLEQQLLDAQHKHERRLDELRGELLAKLDASESLAAQQVDVLQTRLQEVQAERDRAVSDADSLRETLAAAEQTLACMASTHAEEAAKGEDMLTQITELSTALDQDSKLRAGLMMQLESLKRERDALASESAELQASLAAAEHSVRALRQHVQAVALSPGDTPSETPLRGSPAGPENVAPGSCPPRRVEFAWEVEGESVRVGMRERVHRSRRDRRGHKERVRAVWEGVRSIGSLLRQTGEICGPHLSAGSLQPPAQAGESASWGSATSVAGGGEGKGCGQVAESKACEAELGQGEEVLKDMTMQKFERIEAMLRNIDATGLFSDPAATTEEQSLGHSSPSFPAASPLQRSPQKPLQPEDLDRLLADILPLAETVGIKGALPSADDTSIRNAAQTRLEGYKRLHEESNVTSSQAAQLRDFCDSAFARIAPPAPQQAQSATCVSEASPRDTLSPGGGGADGGGMGPPAGARAPDGGLEALVSSVAQSSAMLASHEQTLYCNNSLLALLQEQLQVVRRFHTHVSGAVHRHIVNVERVHHAWSKQKLAVNGLMNAITHYNNAEAEVSMLDLTARFREEQAHMHQMAEHGKALASDVRHQERLKVIAQVEHVEQEMQSLETTCEQAIAMGNGALRDTAQALHRSVSELLPAFRAAGLAAPPAVEDIAQRLSQPMTAVRMAPPSRSASPEPPPQPEGPEEAWAHKLPLEASSLSSPLAGGGSSDASESLQRANDWLKTFMWPSSGESASATASCGGGGGVGGTGESSSSGLGLMPSPSIDRGEAHEVADSSSAIRGLLELPSRSSGSHEQAHPSWFGLINRADDAEVDSARLDSALPSSVTNGLASPVLFPSSPQHAVATGDNPGSNGSAQENRQMNCQASMLGSLTFRPSKAAVAYAAEERAARGCVSSSAPSPLPRMGGLASVATSATRSARGSPDGPESFPLLDKALQESVTPPTPHLGSALQPFGTAQEAVTGTDNARPAGDGSGAEGVEVFETPLDGPGCAGYGGGDVQRPTLEFGRSPLTDVECGALGLSPKDSVESFLRHMGGLGRQPASGCPRESPVMAFIPGVSTEGPGGGDGGAVPPDGGGGGSSLGEGCRIPKPGHDRRSGGDLELAGLAADGKPVLGAVSPSHLPRAPRRHA